MKKVFSNNEVPHIWAQQNQPEGRGSNIFFEGATIYSYGRHFPMATIKGRDVFFTLRTYSNTTAKHLSRTSGAISHKNIIWVYEVPVNFPVADYTHEKNLNYWKKNIKALFDELGNKKNRDIQGRINGINRNIEQLNIYADYFKLKIKDKELKSLLSIAGSPDFLNKLRAAKEKQEAAQAKKMKLAEKSYYVYLENWRVGDLCVAHLDLATISDANFYASKLGLTRLRYDEYKKRVETSKGIEIPVAIAKRAYLALNGCMAGECNDLSIPVLDYTITQTGRDYIKAGCHTIPKEDVRYIANLLKW